MPNTYFGVLFSAAITSKGLEWDGQRRHCSKLRPVKREGANVKNAETKGGGKR